MTYKLNWGGTLLVDCVNNIAAATVTELIFKKPDGTGEVTVTATIADPTHLSYVIPVGFFNVAGRWLVQPNLTFGTSSGGRAQTAQIFITEWME